MVYSTPVLEHRHQHESRLIVLVSSFLQSFFEFDAEQYLRSAHLHRGLYLLRRRSSSRRISCCRGKGISANFEPAALPLGISVFEDFQYRHHDGGSGLAMLVSLGHPVVQAFSEPSGAL